MRDTRTPDQLLRDAVAIRRLLDETGDDDHATRIRLVASQDRVRVEAARQWRDRGWRPITEATLVRRPVRTLLLTPALVVATAALLSHLVLGTAGPAVLLLLVGAAAAPLVAESRGATPREVRRLATVAGAAVALHVATGPVPATLVFLPGASLLAAIALAGTTPPRPPGVPAPADSGAA